MTNVVIPFLFFFFPCKPMYVKVEILVGGDRAIIMGFSLLWI